MAVGYAVRAGRGDGRRAGHGRHRGRVGALGVGCAAGPRADVPRPDAARARALARTVAAGAGLAGEQGGGGAGARRPHYRGLARGVRPRRPGRPGLRADWWSPPALGAEAQAGLKVAVQATPAEVGSALANWNGKVVRQ